MKEKWKGLIYRRLDLSDKYEVSNLGKIKSLKNNIILKTRVSKTGYETVCISLGSRKKYLFIRIHKAVAENFIINTNNYPVINHKDCNKLNNTVDNLEWCTYSENTQHAWDNGLINHPKGEENKSSKLKQCDINFIRNNYKARHKEFCSRALSKKYKVTHSTILSVINNRTWI